MKSGLTPRCLNCQCATKPAEMKASAIMTPNEFMVKPPMWNSSGYIQLLSGRRHGAQRPRLRRADYRTPVIGRALFDGDRTGPVRTLS